MAKRAGFNRYYILSSLVFSLFLSFHLMTGGREFLEILKNNYNYFSVPMFFVKLSLLAALLTALILGFSFVFKAEQDVKQDKYALFAAGLMLALDFVMAYFKYFDRAWLGLYNSIFALAFFTLCLRMKVFENEKTREKEKWPMYFLAVAAVFVAAMGIIRSFSFQDSFFTMAKDMGVLVNSIWRAGEDGSQFTYFDGYRDQRGAHFQPIIYLFAALFKISCSPHLLLFLQAVFSLSAVFFLYLLAEKLLGDKKTALLLSLAFLASPYTARTFAYDYHFDSMYMMMFFAFLYFSETRRFILSAVVLCLAIAIKEEAAVYMALASLFVFLRGRDKRYLLLAACSLIYAVAVIKYLIPSFNYSNSTFAEQALLNLGGGIIKYLDTEWFVQLVLFFLSAAFLPFLSPAALVLLILPPAAVHSLMYVNKDIMLFDLQYASFVTPPLFAAVIYGLKASRGKDLLFKNTAAAAFLVFLLQGQAQLSFMLEDSAAYRAAPYILAAAFLCIAFSNGAIKIRAKYLIFAALTALVFYAGFFKHYEYRAMLVPDKARASINNAIKLIPPGKDAAVVTNTNIAPHLCCRKYIFSMEISTPEEIFTYLRKDGIGEFFMLVYLRDFTYQNMNPEARTERVFDLAKKLGFTQEFLSNDGNTMLIRFYNKK